MKLKEKKKLIKLLISIKNNDIAKVKALLDQGVNPNSYEDKSKLTPLHVASIYGAIEIIELLISNDASIFNTTDDGCLPIYFSKKKKTFNALMKFTKKTV